MFRVSAAVYFLNWRQSSCNNIRIYIFFIIIIFARISGDSTDTLYVCTYERVVIPRIEIFYASRPPDRPRRAAYHRSTDRSNNRETTTSADIRDQIPSISSNYLHCVTWRIVVRINFGIYKGRKEGARFADACVTDKSQGCQRKTIP